MKANRIIFLLVGSVYLLIILLCLFKEAPPLSLDMLSYYSIGRKYASGDFLNALNGYWAPLLPWLLAILFKVGIFWEALQVINVIAGLLIIFYSTKIVELLKLSKVASWSVIILIGGLAIVHQLEITTPDFLSIPCLLGFLYYFYQRCLDSAKVKWYHVSFSALLLIFCKVFYFYFVIALFSFYWFFTFFSGRRKKSGIEEHFSFLKPLGLIIGVYLVWVGILSFKYKQFVFSSTGSYNTAIMTPTGPGLQYYTYAGLTTPACTLCLGNEDYTVTETIKRKPFKSKAAFQNQLNIFAYNAFTLIYLFNYFSYFKWLILLLPLLLLLYNKTPERSIALGFFGAGCLILIGYFLVFYEDRYVLPVLYCFILSTFYYFDRLHSFVLILLIPFVAFAKNGIHTFYNWRANTASSGYEQIYTLTDKLISSGVFEGKRIANSPDAFGSTYLSMIALRSSAQYYGELGIYHTQEQNRKELEKHKINYLFYFDCARIDEKGNCLEKTLPFYLKNKEVIFKDPASKLTIYKLL